MVEWWLRRFDCCPAALCQNIVKQAALCLCLIRATFFDKHMVMIECGYATATYMSVHALPR